LSPPADYNRCVKPSPDYQRRFGGLERLYGAGALARANAAHVAVVGIGGVGSWAAEALARSGIGRLTLVDLDHVAESNINRQVQALGATLGAAKVLAMRERILAINPDCVVTPIEEFIDERNSPALIPACDAVIDAIDHVRAKAALIAHCRGAGDEDHGGGGDSAHAGSIPARTRAAAAKPKPAVTATEEP
jgi:tRNA A37 threonylcarbamoyladenosine dehydratase